MLCLITDSEFWRMIVRGKNHGEPCPGVVASHIGTRGLILCVRITLDMPTVWAVFSFESTAFYISLYHANVVVGYKGLD